MRWSRRGTQGGNPGPGKQLLHLFQLLTIKPRQSQSHILDTSRFLLLRIDFQGNSDFMKTTVVCPAYINTGMFDGVQVIPFPPFLGAGTFLTKIHHSSLSEQDHPDPGPPVCGRPGGRRHPVRQAHPHAPLVDLLPHHAQGCDPFSFVKLLNFLSSAFGSLPGNDEALDCIWFKLLHGSGH